MDLLKKMDKEEMTAIKLLLIGDSGVGKSSVLLRFTSDSFTGENTQMATIGVDFKSKIVDIDGSKYKLNIWDTAGQERFRALTFSYYRGAHGAILVYDVTSRQSFKNIRIWLNELNKYSGNNLTIKMIVGNKVDKSEERVVSTEEGKNLAKDIGTLFAESSAKTSIGITQAFEELVQKIIENPKILYKDKTKSKTMLPNEDEDEQGSCIC